LNLEQLPGFYALEATGKMTIGSQNQSRRGAHPLSERVADPLDNVVDNSSQRDGAADYWSAQVWRFSIRQTARANSRGHYDAARGDRR
jgi:hypothetical protein